MKTENRTVCEMENRLHGDFLFITTQQEYDRIKNNLKAIECGDTELYWADRRRWLELHGAGSRPLPVPQRKRRAPKNPDKMISTLKNKRSCFGNYDPNHTFCTDICTMRDECYAYSRGGAE